MYIAGPMTGYADFNYPAFYEAASAWEAQGWEVSNPAVHSDIVGLTASHATYMRMSIEDLLECDAIAMLPGWESSIGATLEHRIAEVLGMTVLDALSPQAADDEAA